MHSDPDVRESCGDALSEPLANLLQRTLEMEQLPISGGMTREDILACHTVGAMAAEAGNEGGVTFGRHFMDFIVSMTSREWAAQPDHQLALVWEHLLLSFAEVHDRTCCAGGERALVNAG